MATLIERRSMGMVLSFGEINKKVVLLLVAIMVAATIAYLVPVLASSNNEVGHIATISLSAMTPKLAAFLGCSSGLAGAILALIAEYGTSITWLTRVLVWSGFGFAVAAILAVGVSYILWRLRYYGWSATVNW